MANQVYYALMQHYFNLQSEHKECMEQITALKARCKQINYQMTQINDILSEFGNHIYEHFEEKQTASENVSKEK